MKKWIIVVLFGWSLTACQNNDSTQNLRDNETPTAATDVTNNYEIEPDTTATLSDTARLKIADSIRIR